MMTFYDLGSFLLGLAAWLIPMFAFGKKYRFGMCCIGSLGCCVLSIFLQLLEVKRRVGIRDWSALMDTIDAVVLAAVIMVVITLISNAAALFYPYKCQENSDSPSTTWKTRFKGFAASHFLISAVGFAAALPVLMVLDFEPDFWDIIWLEIILLALYVAAGFWKAKRKKWSYPRRFREGAQAFFAPALTAWAWGGLVVVSLAIEAWPLLIAEYFATMVLASPSFLMFYLMMGSGACIFNLVVQLSIFALCAGGLPPLLFTLGSLYGSRQRKEAAQ